MSRPHEPEFVIQWREWDRAGPPKCCHTCEFYSVDGLCIEFFMRPPEDFAERIDSCSQWMREVAF